MLGLLTDLYTRFVKPDAITSASNLLKVKYSERKYQKSRDDMIIGADTRLYLKQIKLSSDEETTFFQSVRNYFMIACDYIIKPLPVSDPLLQ